MRKEFFNNKETGYFKTEKREPVVNNPMTGKSYHTLVAYPSRLFMN